LFELYGGFDLHNVLGYQGFMMGERIMAGFRFAKAAPWPYVTGVGALFTALLFKGMGVSLWIQGNPFQASLFALWGFGWLGIAGFAFADGISRHREYRRIKAMLLKFGYSERIFEPLASSRCQRDAALFAADETGHGVSARAYFYLLGYRWYHVLPDKVVRNPFVFLCPDFLRSSFLPGKKKGS